MSSPAEPLRAAAPGPETTPIAELRAGAVRVGGRTLWRDADLTLREGEFTALLGPNGAGKSTLVRVLLGVVPLSAGTVTVLGRPAHRGDRRIGYLPQRRTFGAHLRIRGRDVVRLGLDGDRWGVPLPGASRWSASGRRAAERVDEVVELVGAGGYANRPIGELSGGEQQRLLIAQALAARPRLLLLDEPLDSLDLPNQAAVAALVARIGRAERVAVLMVAHDVNPILGHLDQVGTVAAGVVTCGPVGEMVTTARLSALFGTPVEVLTTSGGRTVVVGSLGGTASTIRRLIERPSGTVIPPSATFTRPSKTITRASQTITRASRTAARSPAPGLVVNPGTFSWNLIADVRDALSFPFMVNAFRAGAIAAVLAGLTGWFMVLRRQTFAGHSLAVVGVPGAAGAALLGLPAFAGLFAFAVAGALVIGRRPAALTEQPAVVGTVQACALAAGFLFASLSGQFLGGLDSLLFGSFLGITNDQVALMLGLAVAVVAGLAVIGRPLLLASLDPAVAAARGVPVRALSAGFLVLLGLSAAAAGTITGSLLVFALLVLPAATAANLTAGPALGAALSVLIALVVTWLALLVAWFSPYPVGFWLTSLAFGGYALSWAAR